MDKSTSNLLKALIVTWIAVGVFAAFLMFKGWQSAKPLHDLVATLPQLSTDTHDILTYVNRPCKGPFGRMLAARLPEINKMSIAYGDMAHTASIQVAQSGQLVNATTRNMDQVSSSVQTSMLHVDSLTEALKATATQSQDTLQVLNLKIATTNIQPLLDNVNGAVTDSRHSINIFNNVIGRPAIPTIVDNFAEMTTTGNHMLFTFDAVETKATHNYLHPSTNPWKRGWDAFEPFLLPGVQGTAAGLTLVAK